MYKTYIRAEVVGKNYSFVEVPGMLSCVVFFPGCNLRCPFCYNIPCVVNPQIDTYYIGDIADCIVLSGGECTMSYELLNKICMFSKYLGKYVVVETNGHFPDVLKKILSVVDEVRLDIKCLPHDYPKVVGGDWYLVNRTMQLLRGFRVTYSVPVYKPYYDFYKLKEVLSVIPKGSSVRVFNIDDSVELLGKATSVPQEEVEEWSQKLGGLKIDIRRVRENRKSL